MFERVRWYEDRRDHTAVENDLFDGSSNTKVEKSLAGLVEGLGREVK